MDCVLTKLIQDDSTLSPNIKTFGEITRPSDCKAILLTGATGNLGPHLLSNLLKRPQLKIYCLVRKTAVGLGQNILSNLKLDKNVNEKVIWVTGDLSREKLGIESSQYEDLCLEVDAVIHAAVKSHHLEMYQKNVDKPNDLRTVNVLGTKKILEFVTTGKVKRIFYASSILGCNRLSDNEMALSEELIEEDNNGDGLGMGYALSKFICDKLMSQAIRRGIPAFVCRFPLIVFDSQTGYMDFKSNHFFYLLLSFVETGVKPEYPSAFPAIPVDICAKISIDLFLNDEVPIGIYNLMNPHKLSLDICFEKVSKIFGIPKIRESSFEEFTGALVALEKNSHLYPFKMLYFDKDAEEILSHFNLTTKLLLKKENGHILENVSSKLQKFVPDIDELIDAPHDLLIKIMQLGVAAGYSGKKSLKIVE